MPKIVVRSGTAGPTDPEREQQALANVVEPPDLVVDTWRLGSAAGESRLGRAAYCCGISP